MATDAMCVRPSRQLQELWREGLTWPTASHPRKGSAGGVANSSGGGRTGGGRARPLSLATPSQPSPGRRASSAAMVRSGAMQPAITGKNLRQQRLTVADTCSCHCRQPLQALRCFGPPPAHMLPGRAPGRSPLSSAPLGLGGAVNRISTTAVGGIGSQGGAEVLLNLGLLEWYSLGAFVAAMVVVAAAGRETSAVATSDSPSKPSPAPPAPAQAGTQAEDRPRPVGGHQWGPREVWQQAGDGRHGEGGTEIPKQPWQAGEQPMTHPQSPLQALSAPARAELLRKSLSAVERGTAELPEDLRDGSASAWQQAVLVLIRTASAAAAEEWLGRPLLSLMADSDNSQTPPGPRQRMGDSLDEGVGHSGPEKGSDAQEISTGTAPGSLLAERSVIHAVVLRQLRFPKSPDPRRSEARRSQTLRASAPAVVQDLAVVVADRAASALLEEVRCCPSPAEALEDQQLDWPEVLHPRLTSTRAVERFCNQVLLWKWWEVNFRSVQAIYEDRFVLWGFRPGGTLVRRAVPARRGWELSRLEGPRAVVALLLEAMDVAWPVFTMVLTRCKEALCWMLVAIIGQSLGLVARGVRQSMNARDTTTESSRRDSKKPKGRESKSQDDSQTPWTVPTGYGDGAFAF